MVFLKSALIVASLAAISSAASVRRQTPPTCSTSFTGQLALKPASEGENDSAFTYVGIVPNAKHSGTDGSNDHLLVTKNDDGSPVQPQEWEFARCTSDDGHALPPGYKTPTSGPTNLSYGIIRPKGATQHCLALESKNDANTGARNSIVDSFCTKVPEEYRLWMLEKYIYGSSGAGSRLFFANENETAIIGDTAHAEVQFFTKTSMPEGKTAQQLVIVPT
ncbi:hypothetical protein BDZ90DRAFT_257199 [Jaminaea rosea]|uniref:Ricin B lectin domain-containing protein n=1 Tax=Jaminaea rosea TaxID=1569628 RepID=A0A316UZ80_9BASI|nr:hypothetical protein BDZ90DRAFT_257199 [Jaminaea rosea]PWN30098.1 hypothetical protein BDZ90DRAFT_257199 [Jaminaea rosea]